MIYTNVICNWYNKLFINVRWNGQNSSSIPVTSGERQRGVLSPILFNIYVDYIISALESMRLGCRLRNVYVGCVMYADDLILMSLSILDLQLMLNVCGLIGHDIGMKFNFSKCKLTETGTKKIDMMGLLTLANVELQWVSNIK